MRGRTGLPRGRAVLLLPIALGIAGCRCTPEPPRPVPDGANAPASVLRVRMEAEPPTLNPLVEHDAWTTWIALGAIYDPLVRYDPATGAFAPALAVRFDAPDERTLRFALRAGVTWHDGRPFSADDVAATLELVMDPEVGADQRVDLVDLVEVRHLTPNEVVLRFREPSPLALQALAHLPILPAHAIAAAGEAARRDLRAAPISRAPVGTGAFRFVEWKSGDRIVLERNPRWFGAPPKVDRLELRLVRDPDAALALLRDHEIDLIWQRPTASLGQPAPDGAAVTRWTLPYYSFVVWNQRRPGLGDARVRRALSLLVDRSAYLRTAFHGAAQPISGPYPLDSPSYDRSIAPWPHDPARARELLDEAGVVDRDGDRVREVAGKPFTIRFLYRAGSMPSQQLATMMQEDFRAAGIVLEATPIDWGAMLTRLRSHDFDAATLQWLMQPIQQNYDVFHSSQAEHGQNFGGLRDPEVDALLDRLRRTPIGPARVELDHRLHRRIHDLQPYTFLGVQPVESLISTRISGYAPSSEGLGFGSLFVKAGAR